MMASSAGARRVTDVEVSRWIGQGVAQSAEHVLDPSEADLRPAASLGHPLGWAAGSFAANGAPELGVGGRTIRQVQAAIHRSASRVSRMS